MACWTPALSFFPSPSAAKSWRRRFATCWRNKTCRRRAGTAGRLYWGQVTRVKKTAGDILRSEYKRSDFGTLVRGKYVAQLRKSSNVVVVDPDVADLFPNAAAVNAALRSLAEIAKRADSRRSRAR